MTDIHDEQLEEVRSVLLRSEREELVELRARVEKLEELLTPPEVLAESVGSVLVDAVAAGDAVGRPSGALGSALRPDVEHAVRESAFGDSTVLAEALYPVIGPAIRKSIASLFSLDSATSGRTFRVDQVMLIHRESGVLLAAAASDKARLDDADVVSGMLDAVRMFVQDAFDKPDHDGLQDLRVGDTSVLVEWGPDAVLASVVNGIATDNYRTQATAYLEELHVEYAEHLEAFNGDVGPFAPTEPELLQLYHNAKASVAKRYGPLVAAALLLIAIIVVVLVIIL